MQSKQNKPIDYAKRKRQANRRALFLSFLNCAAFDAFLIALFAVMAYFVIFWSHYR